MKFSLLGIVAVGVLAVACKVETTDDNDGGTGGSAGGEGGTGGAVTNGGSGGTGGTPVACGDIGCDGTSDPTTNCVACTQDVGGDCEAEATACTEACGMVFDCLDACPDDNPATADVDELWQCICSSNTPNMCDAPMAGSCFADTVAAQQFLDLNGCFFDTCTDPTCQ